jgi:DNA repair protein RecO (recombination protein O)
MLHKTEGIVLSTLRYSDRYAISHVYTPDYGTISYLLPLVNNKKAKIKTSLFFPLSILRMEVEHLPNRDIQKLKEVERLIPLYEICTDMSKVSIVFFLSEFLFRVLRESDNNEITFQYIKNSVETLEEANSGIANFHITFMIGLTRFLGIYPNWDRAESDRYFDMLNGEFIHNIPSHTYYLKPEESMYLKYLNRINYGNMQKFKLSRDNRNTIINYLLEYYRLHLYDFPKLKSLDILREMS